MSVARKVVVLGLANVGKTTLIRTSMKQVQTDEVYSPTFSDLYTHNILVDSHSMKLHIWDTAGLENYRSITRQVYRDVSGFILMFDCSDLKTLDTSLTYIEQEMQCCLELAKYCKFLLVGNKRDKGCDVKAIQKAIESEHKLLARLKLVYCTAKSEKDAQEVFHELGKILLTSMPLQEQIRSEHINLNSNAMTPEKRSSSCC